MVPLVPIYTKYMIDYQIVGQDGIRKATLYAENDSEVEMYLQRILDFPLFSMASKKGTVMQTIKQKTSKIDDGSTLNPEAYFIWINRKYYFMDDALKAYMLRNMEAFEEYEICCFIRDNEFMV